MKTYLFLLCSLPVFANAQIGSPNDKFICSAQCIVMDSSNSTAESLQTAWGTSETDKDEAFADLQADCNRRAQRQGVFGQTMLVTKIKVMSEREMHEIQT